MNNFYIKYITINDAANRVLIVMISITTTQVAFGVQLEHKLTGKLFEPYLNSFFKNNDNLEK